jgi:hypothetical protein
MPVARTFVVLLLLLAGHLGCGAETDLSHTPQYASEIGSQYRSRVELFALVLKNPNDTKQFEKVWISPFEKLPSPDVAFRRAVPIGHLIRVLAVRKRAMPFDNGLEFIVAIDGLDVPGGLEIVVPLYAELQSNDGFPSQKYFEKVP